MFPLRCSKILWQNQVEEIKWILGIFIIRTTYMNSFIIILINVIYQRCVNLFSNKINVSKQLNYVQLCLQLLKKQCFKFLYSNLSRKFQLWFQVVRHKLGFQSNPKTLQCLRRTTVLMEQILRIHHLKYKRAHLFDKNWVKFGTT